jgi:transglutaminase-like putative cysteine protease
VSLQDWFRENFEYSTDVPAGHGNDAIEHFLQIRKGYCEQFATTFAVMARTLGIPSRVAVGYTPGRLRADGWYSVVGRNSHAWPEIWFDSIGWVGFEPTPTRSIPGAERSTVMPAAQDESLPTAPTSAP